MNSGKFGSSRNLSIVLAVSGLALASIEITGCDRVSSEAVAALNSSVTANGASSPDGQKATFAEKLAVNHNETFICG